MKIAGLFPGQGSQIVGMGKELYEAETLAREVFDEADSVLGFSLSELCFNGPLEELTLTKFAQPAILTTSYAAFRVVQPELSSAAGHSLGEYTALVAAKSLTLADAISLVHKRGRYMQEAVEPGHGKMLAVIGPTEDAIRAILDSSKRGIAEIANLNCPGQTVIAGDVEGIDAASELLQKDGAKVISLNVSAPFHCSLMKPAASKLAVDLDAIEFSDPQFPVYANATAEVVSTGTEARELLKQQVASPVRWTQSMEQMIEDQAIDTTIEFGPGGVLSKLLKRIKKGTKMLQAFDPKSLEATRACALTKAPLPH